MESAADDEGGEDEALMMQLFLPRTSSIGSASEVDPLDLLEIDGDLAKDRLEELEHNRTAWNGQDKSGDGVSMTSSVASLKQTEKQLKRAEKDFLSSGRDQVRAGDKALPVVAERFKLTAVPENPLQDDDHVAKYMNNFLENAVKDSVNTASPSMIGHMTSSLPYFMRPLSRLVTTLNQNVVKTETGNTMTFLEREALAQLHKQLYDRDEEFYKEYGQDAKTVLGVFASGGTIANVTAMWVARNLALSPSHRNDGNDAQDNFLGVEQEGLFASLTHFGYQGAVVIGSQLLHYSMSKAADVLGLGVKCLRSIPYDSDFRVKINLVRAALQDCAERKILVVALLGIAGATETGSIDDLSALADLAQEFKTHFHVDAAWGGPLIFSRKHKHLLKGIERADSVTLDGHKQLYMPMGCGLCFFKDPRMSLAIRKTARYIIRKDSYDLGKFTLEGSRPANAIYLHSNLNIFGVRGYEILVNRSVRMVKYMAEQIDSSKGLFQLVVRPMSNILLYRCVPPHLHGKSCDLSPEENKEVDELNVELQRLQTLQGKTFVSRTTVQSPIYGLPIVALRVVIANPLTFEADIDRVLRNQVGILKSDLGLDVSMVSDKAFGECQESPTTTKTNQPDVAQTSRVKNQVVGETAKAAPAQGSGNPSRVENNDDKSKYWTAYWFSMPQQLRNLFKNNKELFISSLVAPELELEKGGGLFSAERRLQTRQSSSSSSSSSSTEQQQRPINQMQRKHQTM